MAIMAKKDYSKQRKPSPRPRGAHGHLDPLEREHMIEEVGKLSRRGLNTFEIAAKVGLSRATVASYIDKIRQAYKNRQLSNHAEMIQEKLAQYREIRSECWAAWERSKEDTQKSVTEYVPGFGDIKTLTEAQEGKGKSRKPKDGSAHETVMKLKEIITKEGRLPANVYITSILETLKAERELRGLDPAKELDVRQVNINWDSLYDRAKSTNEIEVRLQEEEQKLLGTNGQTNGQAETNGHQESEQ